MDLFIQPRLLVRLFASFGIFRGRGEREENEQFWTLFVVVFVFGKGDFVQLKEEE